MSNNLIADLEQFTKEMAKHDPRQAIQPEPICPSPEVLNLRVTLIEEEVQETIKAMYELEEIYRDVYAPERAARMKEVMAEVADGIADSIVVLIGTALAYGIPLQKVWDEVHRANMDKVTKVCEKCKGDGGRSIIGLLCEGCHGTAREPITPRIREDGKILKPDGWREPQVQQIIEEAMK